MKARRRPFTERVERGMERLLALAWADVQGAPERDFGKTKRGEMLAADEWWSDFCDARRARRARRKKVDG